MFCSVGRTDRDIHSCLSRSGIYRPLCHFPCIVLLHVVVVKREIPVVGFSGIDSMVSQRAHAFRDELGLDKSARKAKAKLVGGGDHVLYLVNPRSPQPENGILTRHSPRSKPAWKHHASPCNHHAGDPTQEPQEVFWIHS